MTKSRVGEMLKEMRGEATQLSLGLDLNLTRETVSKYENGRSKVPPDISNKLMKKYDNPWFALQLQHEYTGTGPVRLDGPNVDLHRSSVKEKVLEELHDATNALESFSMSKPLKRLSSYEMTNLQNVLKEVVELITGADTLLAVVCEEANISYKQLWNDHYIHLRSAGYIGGMK